MSCLAVLGCAASGPGDRTLAESVGITLVACLPNDVHLGGAVQVITDLELGLAQGLDVLPVRSGMTEIERGAIDCLFRAGADCVAARACLGLEVRPTPSCGGEAPHCLAGHLVRCFEDSITPAYRTAVDCSVLGRVCVQNGPESATCADSICPLAPEPVRTCVDERHLETCTDGALVRTTCPPGTACSNEHGECVGVGETCRGGGCDGAVALPCDPVVLQTSTPLDCGALGLACSWPFRPADPPRCESVGAAECNRATNVVCDDGTLVYCGIEGRFRRYDCEAHGYLGCDADGETCRAASPAL